MTIRRIISALSAAIVALATGASTATEPVDAGVAPAGFELELKAGLVTIEARDAPLSEIVRAIGDHAGFEIILMDDIDIPLSASFQDLSVEDALERLLQDADWVVTYGLPEQGTTNRVITRLLVFESTGAAVDAVLDAASPAEPGAAAGSLADDAGSAMSDDPEQPDENERARIMLGLANSGATPEVLATLTQALQGDDSAWVRGRAATALGFLQDEHAVSDLAWALGDENASVRMQAVQALGRIGGDRAIWALGVALVNGTTSMERIQAGWALGKQNSELARYLLEGAAGDPSDLVYRSSLTPPTPARGRAAELPTEIERRGTHDLR